VKSLAAYAGAALAVVAVVVAGAWALAAPPARSALWFAAGLAYVLQVGAFAGLVAVRDRGSLFTVAWAGGMMIRFVALAAVAFWLSRSEVLPLEPALLGLVGVMFVLVLLEAMFLRWEMRS
jgi:hypothetical protein